MLVNIFFDKYRMFQEQSGHSSAEQALADQRHQHDRDTC